MKHKIISTENYLLIVDDSQITEGDYCLANAKTYNNEIVTYRKSPCPPPFVSNLNILKKIIAHLPLNGASILDGVDLLPPLEDEAEVMAEEYSKNYYYDNAQDDVYHGFFIGYNKAKEQYKYTEEDLRKVIDMARKDFDEEGYLIDRLTEDEIIQSLQQPKYPIGLECEQSLCFPSHCFRDCDMMCKYPRPKTTTNSQGLTQWVGKYIF